MKKIFKSFTLITLIMILTLMSLGVRCSGTEYADEYTNIKWYSNEPDFEFYVYEDKSNILGKIEIDNEIIPIKCAWGIGYILDVFRYGENFSSSDILMRFSGSDILMRFSYTIKNKVVYLTVIEDKLYEGKYNDNKIRLYYEDL